MTISQLPRKISASAYLVTPALLALACSGGEAAGPEGGAGSSSAGSPSAGSSSGASSSGGSSSGASQDVIGAFQVSLEAAGSKTEVIGKVNDTALPPNVLWEDTEVEGDCRLQEPSSPFCDPGCGGDICAAENTCVPYPVGHGVGEVTVSGVTLTGGETQLILKEINANYQAPANTTYMFPPFAEGDEIKVHAAGGDYAGFDLLALGVAPLSLTSTDFALAEDKPLELTWDAASDPKQSPVHLKLDISHHGGARGRIDCDTNDDGSLTISGAMITGLIGLGVSGFPTVELTRVSTGEASIAQGRVQLRVSSFVSQAVTVDGVTSCNADTCEGNDDPGCIGCPDGMMCRMDLACE